MDYWQSVEYLTQLLDRHSYLPPGEQSQDTKAAVLTVLAQRHISNGASAEGKLCAEHALEIVETRLVDVEAGFIAGEKVEIIHW